MGIEIPKDGPEKADEKEVVADDDDNGTRLNWTDEMKTQFPDNSVMGESVTPLKAGETPKGDAQAM